MTRQPRQCHFSVIVIVIAAAGPPFLTGCHFSVIVAFSDRTVHLKISDVLQPDQTTMCILPSGVPTGDNLTAERRSMKAMQASLHGIPLVSPSWIDWCLRTREIAAPEAGMYVRTLPTKTNKSGKDDDDSAKHSHSHNFEFGVAFVAAAAAFYAAEYGSRYTPLNNTTAYLVGFASQSTATYSNLLRQAGAGEVILQKREALSKVRAIAAAESDDSTGMVILCNDTNATFTDAFVRQVRLVNARSARVVLVNAQWLFDSVSCGVALDPREPYRPRGGQAKELWELTQGRAMLT